MWMSLPPHFRGCGAAGVSGEELPVTLLDVGIAVPARGEHEVEIPPQVILRVIAAARDEGFDEHSAELEIERVFARAQELVIVNPALPPVLRLLVQDVAALVERRVGRAPEDAVRVRVSGSQVIPHDAVIAAQRGAVVIPMHRHGEGVADEGAPDETRWFVRQDLIHNDIHV